MQFCEYKIVKVLNSKVVSNMYSYNTYSHTFIERKNIWKYIYIYQVSFRTKYLTLCDKKSFSPTFLEIKSRVKI